MILVVFNSNPGVDGYKLIDFGLLHWNPAVDGYKLNDFGCA